MSQHLAQLFHKNWLKKSVTTLNLTATGAGKEFTDELQKLGCPSLLVPFQEFMGGTSDLVSAITSLNGWENVDDVTAESFIRKAKCYLADDGVVFIRAPKDKWSVLRFLAVLDKNPYFKVQETYEVGDSRDFILKRMVGVTRPRICAGLIAKNEERDLPKLLKSLEGVVDGIVLLDTGSTDNTLEIAREWAERQPAPDYMFVFPATIKTYFDASEKDENGDWKLWNFGKARNEYVRLIEQQGFDYVLWMDADDILMTPEIKNLVFLEQPVMHGVTIESGGSAWTHHRLWKTKNGIKYHGWCHEYPGWSGMDMVHPELRVFHDAAPNTSETSNARNLRILKRQMEKEPTARTAFYLANTHKDGGRPEEAIPAYQKRMDFGYGYEDEYWFSVLYKARCERATKKYEQAKATLLYAMTKRSDWAEFPMELAYLEGELGNHERSIAWAMLAKDLPIPPTMLWREKDKYLDQPYRWISWEYQHLESMGDALRWAMLAKPKIGVTDQPWENRIKELTRKISSSMFAEIAAEKDVKKKNRIVWHRPGAIGDVLMTLNLVQKFRADNPNAYLIYRTHESTANLIRNIILEAGFDEVVTTEVPCDKEYTLIGYPLAEGYPKVPMKQHLLQYFGKELGLSISPNDLPALVLAKPPLPDIGVKSEKYVTLHAQAGWSKYKNWHPSNWEKVVKTLSEMNIPVVQIGGAHDAVVPGTLVELGLPFEKSLAVLANAGAHMGVDSWSNHATNFMWKGRRQVPGVILWGSTQAEAAGYFHNENFTSFKVKCQPCFKEDPAISANPQGVCPNMLTQDPADLTHACMRDYKPHEVARAVVKQFFRSPLS